MITVKSVLSFLLNFYMSFMIGCIVWIAITDLLERHGAPSSELIGLHVSLFIGWHVLIYADRAFDDR